jgi:hypothetical protein
MVNKFVVTNVAKLVISNLNVSVAVQHLAYEPMLIVRNLTKKRLRETSSKMLQKTQLLPPILT